MHARPTIPAYPATMLAVWLVALAGSLASGPAAAQRFALEPEARTRIDQVFDFVSRDAPGCAMGVVQDGRLTYSRGYGLANLDWGIPLTSSTVFDIGSVSKQFTATALALLDIDGVLSLDDEVRKWIPELPDYGQPLTVRHLLHHTSGVRDYLTLMSLQGRDFDNVFDEFDGVELVARQKALNFAPGSEFLYSNSGYLLLANIVRRATGESLREFLESRVFDPLGMVHTTIWDDNSEVLKQRATGYQATDDGWRIDHAWNFQMGGDGQVITSVEDLARWDANFDDPTVGGPELLQRLLTPGVLTDGTAHTYALGLGVGDYRGLKTVAHGGSWAGFRAFMGRSPEQKTTIVVLCNRSNAAPRTYYEAIADIVLADHFEEEAPAGAGEVPAAEAREDRQPVQLERAQLARWQGVYRKEGAPTVVVELREDRLFGLAQGEAFALRPYSETDFEVVGPGIRISFAEADSVPSLTLAGDTLVRVARQEPKADDRSTLAGRYHSAELDVSYEIESQEEDLLLHRPGREPQRLLYLTGDEYQAAGLGLTFIRDDGGVREMHIDAGRVKGIVFAKQSR